MSVKSFIRELNGSRVEGELIKGIAYSLFASFAIMAILYYTRFRFIENFFPTYGIYLFFAAMSYAIIIPVSRQVKAFKQFPCMSGMMIGMTVGMIGGFLAGYYIGATNGLFVGSIFGMGVGIILGVWLGRCCGIMGVMEGTMAGFMAGPMGAMTAVMLLNDNVRAMTVIMYAIGAFIIFALNYMIYLETKGADKEVHKDYFAIIIINVVLMALTSFVMVYGPRSSLFS